MDRVQLADNPLGRGCQNMSDTDTTYANARPSAMGDLRFAGTIATGLVAGTLGLGALAAPLVGWKDWPSALGKDTSSAQPLKLAPVNVANPPEKSRGSSPKVADPVPSSATTTPIPLPGGLGAGTGPAGVNLNVLINNSTKSSPSDTSDIGGS